MAKKIATVASAVGLHARPAAMIADAAAEFDAEVLLSLEGSDEEGVDASSAMLIMTLGAGHGSRVVVESEDAAAVEAMVSLIETDLDKH